MITQSPRAGGYMVRHNWRPNALAAGVSVTLERRKGAPFFRPSVSNDANRLAVRGTTDILAVGLMFKVTRRVCGCCSSKQHGKLVLNEGGRLRLRALRRRRAARLS